MFLPDGFGFLILGLPAANVRLTLRLVELLVFAAAILVVRTGVFSHGYIKLRAKGLDLLLAGKPAEAEKCYRAALDQGTKVPESDRVRLLVCLGDALIDQNRYDEAKQYLTQALALVDPTGSGQGSMCDLLLAQKAEPEKAIEMAEEAMRLQAQAISGLSFGSRWAAVSQEFYEAKTWARKSQALHMLDRQTEAQQALDRAVRIVETSKSEMSQAMPQVSLTARLILGNRLSRLKYLTIADTYWRIGLALLDMHDNTKATEFFQVVRDTDPMGKYRTLAKKQLDRIG
jgi:tetratricopeptide (TPR) repeat protein